MAKRKLPKSWTKVTPLSKTLALVLFVLLPFAGFYLGLKTQPILLHQATPPQPSPRGTPDPTSDWKLYQDIQGEYSFKYPADYLPYYISKDNNVFHSPDATYDKKTTAKLTGVDLGSLVFTPQEDKQNYIANGTKPDPTLASKLNLPTGATARVYDNLEDITVVIDYKRSNQNKRILLWCGGDKGNLSDCLKVLNPLLPTFKLSPE